VCVFLTLCFICCLLENFLSLTCYEGVIGEMKSRASVSGRMDVYYAQKFAKYVLNPEADVRLRPNFEAGRNRTSRITALA